MGQPYTYEQKRMLYLFVYINCTAYWLQFHTHYFIEPTGVKGVMLWKDLRFLSVQEFCAQPDEAIFEYTWKWPEQTKVAFCEAEKNTIALNLKMTA